MIVEFERAAPRKNVPQGLKPQCKQSTFGTAEAAPFSKAGFFRGL
jgi:hypothetical protein